MAMERGQADPARFRAPRWWLLRAAPILIVWMLVAALTPAAPAKADHHKPWDQAGSAWQGTISYSYSASYFIEQHPQRLIDTGGATYTDLLPVDAVSDPLNATADGNYASAIDTGGGTENWTHCETFGKWEETTFFDSVVLGEEQCDGCGEYPSRFSLLTDDQAVTTFYLGGAYIPFTGNYSGECGPKGSWESIGSNGFPISGPLAQLGFALKDTDPDPLHLVGQTTQAQPASTPDTEVEEYEFKVIYDLWLEDTPVDCEPPVSDPVTCYAPQIIFHPKEHEWPMSIGTFIKNASLRWDHNAGCSDHELAERNTVKAVELGDAALQPYRHDQNRRQNVVRCRGTHYGPRYQASSFTRPRDTSSDRLGLEKNEGFFLDLNNKKRAGTSSKSGNAGTYVGSNLYYEMDPNQRWIRFYVMYGWSHAPYELDRKIRRQLKLHTGLEPPRYLCCHEGEWEGISLKLDVDGVPTHAFYNADHDGVLIPWDSVPKEGTHPIVYSARGAHASYPTADHWQADAGDDVTGDGRAWATWERPTQIVDVRSQDWYGFGGAWGGVEPLNKLPAIAGAEAWLNLGSNFVGPLGPSSYMKKSPWECPVACFPPGYREWP